MSKDKKKDPKKKEAQHPPLKPNPPNTEGAPDNHDPGAQYEDKDNS